jgi:serine/threonine-protein kinase
MNTILGNRYKILRTMRHIAYPGDRVQILASNYDSGGYIWYKVYFPKSGAEGWIAGQLIKKN